MDKWYTKMITDKEHVETIQDWVRRIFTNLLTRNALPEEEIANLHDKKYSSTRFKISYPLLVDTLEQTTDKNKYNRYWKTPFGRYYVCSQWDKKFDRDYEILITLWLREFYPEYIEHGLDRSRW